MNKHFPITFHLNSAELNDPMTIPLGKLLGQTLHHVVPLLPVGEVCLCVVKSPVNHQCVMSNSLILVCL